MKRQGGQIRIIGGLLRRTPIAVAGGVEQMRPTPDRVRETLFNWLGAHIEGVHCLDLFAGTGILGLEAASRGAQSVVFVERHAQAALSLRRRIERFRDAADPAVQTLAQSMTLIKGDASQQLARLSAQSSQFGVVFADPPFGEDWVQRLADGLPQVLDDQALVYYESATEIKAIPPVSSERAGPVGGFKRVRHDRAGQVHYHLFSYHSDPGQ